MTLTLLEPEKYEGYSRHPANDDTLRRVKAATIEPTYPDGWVKLVIIFTDGKRFMSSSPSVRGAKQQFAFQCKGGSKWKEEIKKLQQ